MFLLLFWTKLLFIATILMISRLTVHEMFCQILELQWQLGAWPCASFLISPPAKQNDLQEKQGSQITQFLSLVVSLTRQ